MKHFRGLIKSLATIPRTYALWWRRLQDDWRSATVEEKLAGLLALTLPLERVPALDIAGFTVRLSMVFGSMLILRAALAVSRAHSPRVSKVEWLLLAFGAWSTATLLIADDFTAGLQVVLPTIYVLALALSIGRVVRIQKLVLLISLLVCGAVFASIFGIFQFIGDFAGLPHWITAMRDEYSWQRFGFPRVLSTALEPLFFSAFLLLPLSFVLAYFGRSQHAIRRIALLSLAVLFIGIDVLTVSRGGILALAMLLFVTAVFIAVGGNGRAAAKYVGRLAVVVMISIIVGLGLLAAFNRPGQDTDVTYGTQGIGTFVNHLVNTHITPNQENIAKEDSVAARSSARDFATEVVTRDMKNFIVGVGPGQYRSYSLRVYGPPERVVANVLPLDIMLNSGAIGLVLVGLAMIMIFIGLLKLIRRQVVIAAALAAYMLAIGLQSLTFPTLYITHIWFAVGIAMVLLRQASVKR